MKRRHIVLVANDVGGVGGMEKHLEEMIARMKQDFSVTVVSSSFRVKDPSGVRFIRIPVVRKPFLLMTAMFSVLASIRLWFLRDSMIHTTGAIVFHPADVSTIHFCHAGYIHAVPADSRQGKALTHKVNALLSLRIKLYMEKICYHPRRTTQLVAVSGRIRHELQAFYPYPAERIKVIANGVDVARFHPRPAEEKVHLRTVKHLPPDGMYLLFMGGDWERKGLRLLLSAFNMLAGEYANLRVLVVGSGDAETFMHTVEPTYRDRVYFPGRQQDPEDWYGLANIFVFPSHYEACSLAVLEAAASGLGMVLTDVGGARDVVDDGVSGCIVAPYGAEIARTIAALLDNPVRMYAMGRQARARVESMTWDDTYRQFKELYERLSPVGEQQAQVQIREVSSNDEPEGATKHA